MMVLDNTKDAEIRFRVPAWLKDDFLSYCERRDIPAAHLLRRFVRAVLTERALNFEDEVQVLKAKPFDCPRCGCSEVKSLSTGYGLCLECRLVWRELPEGSEIYQDRIVEHS